MLLFWLSTSLTLNPVTRMEPQQTLMNLTTVLWILLLKLKLLKLLVRIIDVALAVAVGGAMILPVDENRHEVDA